MSKWHQASGRVASARVSDEVYEVIKARADAIGVTVGVYVKQVLTKGASKYVTPT